MYPTLVFEVAHRNESWRRRKDDARNKVFSRLTSIQVVIGVKIYAHHFRAFWAHRRTNPNHGMSIQQTTEKLDVKLVTQDIFRIPSQYIFFGVPANMVPLIPTPSLDLKLEKIRNAIARFM
jgi:cobalamin biosynthesis protein CobD/CbiB